MGCCFCCLSEGEKVGRVLAKFPGNRVANGQADAIQRLVGRVTMAQSTGFYSPVEDTPCVYFRIKIQEEWKETYHVEVDDGDGRSHREKRTRKVWKTVCDEERFCDFYIQDGASKVFIKGSDRGHCKVQSICDAWGNSGKRFWDAPPPGVIRFIVDNLPAWDWQTRKEHRTGRYQFQEQKFEVNELVTCFGILKNGVDPMTGQGVGILQPVHENMIDEKFMEEQEFTSWDKSSWKEMTETPAVLLSDNKEFTADFQDIPIAVNLPAYMTTYMPAIGGGQVQVVIQNPGMQMAQPMGMAQVQMTTTTTTRSGGGGGGGEVDFKLKSHQKDLALDSLRDLKNATVYIVNKKTESPIKMRNDGSIFGNGGLGDAATWNVEKMDRKDEGRPVVGFRNEKHDKYLAIKGGEITCGGGGEHCEFIVERKGKAVLLIKHNNQNAKMGFNESGRPADPNDLGEGDRARFFIFDVEDVKDRFPQ